MSDAKPWNSNERLEQYDSLFPVLPNYVAHYTLGNPDLVPQIGLADRTSLALAEDILAVLISSGMRISHAYARKRYIAPLEDCRWLGLTYRIDSIFKTGRTAFDHFASLGKEQPQKEGSYEDLSLQFFYRNLASFDAAKRLSELGYLCEVAAILRSALEQFSFSAELWGRDGTDDLKALRPNHSIGWLKKQVPEVGRLYGILSKYTHFEYDHHTHFFTHSSAEIRTLQRSSVLRAYATHLLFVVMACVSRYILNVAPQRFAVVPEPIHALALFIRSVDKYSDEVCLMLPTDKPLANLDVLLQAFVRPRP